MEKGPVSWDTILVQYKIFGNFWATNFITKVAQRFGDFLGSCDDNCYLNQTGQATFWATFGKTWAIFYFNIWSHWSHDATDAAALTSFFHLSIYLK